MKRKIIIGLSIYVAGFLALAAIRLAYVVLSTSVSQTPFSRGQGMAGGGRVNQSANEFDQISIQKKNYATDKRQIVVKDVPNGSMLLDQKYERVASLQTRAREFDLSEKAARSNIQLHQAVVQYEKRSGLAGARSLILTIGVVPGRFDLMVEDLRKIGTLVSFDVDKFDRTSEFKETTAKRRSLEAMRASLVSLKSRGGSIKEFVDLEKQMYEIESQIQALGVTLGDFSEENELCTVRLSLFESKPKTVPLYQQAAGALSWAAGTYALVTLILGFACLGLFIGILIFDKLAPRVMKLFKD